MADQPSLAERNPEHTAANGVATDDRTFIEPKQCCHKLDSNSRNLIVCIDGTSNQFGEKNTNVIEMYNLILKEVGHNQRTWYNSGIGTYAQPSWKSLKFYAKVLSHKIDLAIAWNFERTILAAYQWLSDNYEPGDCIFLFGFSRGAYQVRVLSAMIDKVGLIYKGNETQIPFAYELYSDPKSDIPTVTGVGSQTQQKMSMADRFKETFSYKDVTVHFVGAWDTVSSIGFARGNHILPRTIEGMQHVCYFRHALALDERRVKFLPEYAYGGTAKPTPKAEDKPASPVTEHPPKDSPVSEKSIDDGLPDHRSSIHKETMDSDRSQSRMKLKGKPPHTMEVWFAGTHSDIGGGNVNNAGMDRSRPPLRWMVFEAGALGLRTARFERELPPNEQIEIQESLTWVWWPLELFFFKRLTFTRREDGKQTTHKPHLGSSRKIHVGQKIHSSLILTDKTHREYTPKARPPPGYDNFWEKARTKGLGDWLELDLYDYTETLVKSLGTECPGTALQTLHQTAISADGWQAVYEGVIRTLRDTNVPQIKHQFLHSAIQVLGKHARENSSLSCSNEIFPLVKDLWESNIKRYQEVVQRFLVRFTDFCMFVMDGHTHGVHSVAFSPDGKRVVSGSADMTVRIWDATTGEAVGAPSRGHSNSARSVAYSPDGRRIVSGALDGTVRIWEMGKPMGEPLRGHTESVCSLAFSPDGTRVVSGSLDKTFRIWDAKTGKSIGEPFRGHQNPVRSVAFSPDGRDVLSASSDTTVWIWNMEMKTLVGDLSKGHTGWVQSIAFSPDGTRVASGSLDKTVRIWDAKTGTPVGGPFRGHTSSVLCGAFSPDGKHVVSGSEDKTVRIWNVMTGKPVGGSFRGHTQSVCSVAFSPDGSRIVSGSLDRTVRIWDAKTAMTVADS